MHIGYENLESAPTWDGANAMTDWLHPCLTGKSYAYNIDCVHWNFPIDSRAWQTPMYITFLPIPNQIGLFVQNYYYYY